MNGMRTFGVAIALAWGLAAGAAEAQDAVRMAMEAFDTEAQIEVRNFDPASAQEVIQEALTEIYAIQRLLDPEILESGGIAYLQKNAGRTVTVDPRLGELLARDLQYCLWSSGSYSPPRRQRRAPMENP